MQMTDATPSREAAENEKLAGAAEGVAQAAIGAIEWLSATDDPRARERASAMARDLRRGAARAQKLAAAARRPMCVSVFGPSQQGKSYLIGSLARLDPKPCKIRFGPEFRDFFMDINPAGGKESTGLVTRFTAKPVEGLPGMPVVCRMLSQTDVLKIIANAFMEDFDRDTVVAMEAPAIEAHIARLRGKAAPQPVDGLSEDDVFDLFEYFERYFRNHPTHVALKPAFWRELETLGPRLPVADRVELFSLLWNGTPTMTKVARRMILALASLGFPAEAYCGMDALEPRAKSIIDVETMQGIDGDGGETVMTATRTGQRAALTRSVLTAVTAELCLQLEDRPYDFFEHTDLLDFPGARSRGKEDARDPERVAAQQIFLLVRRGKVAYLYQRYLAEQELTSMLLCFRDSNQEVASVPFMVNDWIETTHGATPAARAKVGQTALFLILTMFDREFELKAGQKDDSVERWSTRFETVIKSFLAKSHDWPNEWTPGTPFSNSYWLRNPAIRNDGLIEYDGAREAEEPAPPAPGAPVSAKVRNPERIAMLRANFIANHEAQKHFANPALAWDAAMAANDGGIGRIARALGPVCNPALKRGQVGQQLADVAAKLARELEPFYVSGDLEAELKKRMAEAKRAMHALMDAIEAQRFGALLREMQVEVADLVRIFAATSRSAATIGRTVDTRRTRGRFADPDAAPAAESNGPRDLADALAEAALKHWQETLQLLIGRADAPGLFRLDQQHLTVIAAQLIEGERRLALRTRIAGRIRQELSFPAAVADRFTRPAMIAERMVNEYVTFLGFDALAPAARPASGVDDTRRIFVRPPAAEEVPDLDEADTAYETAYCDDWADAFLATVEANVKNVGGAQMNVEANMKLGSILGALRRARDLAA
jgi:hypothetical protein